MALDGKRVEWPVNMEDSRTYPEEWGWDDDKKCEHRRNKSRVFLL